MPGAFVYQDLLPVVDKEYQQRRKGRRKSGNLTGSISTKEKSNGKYKTAGHAYPVVGKALSDPQRGTLLSKAYP